MNLTIKITRQDVLDEIAKTTGYTGAKLLPGDPGAYQRISLTDSDAAMLERFWQESRDNVGMALRRMLAAEDYDGESLRLELRLSQAFDTAQCASMQTAIYCYFVHSITARWLALVGSGKALEYTASAASILSDIERKALCKRAPVRPRY